MALRFVWSAVRRNEDHGTWITDEVFACPYPRGADALAGLAVEGISVIVNLHRRRHVPLVLWRLGLTEVHIPVRDFTAPAPSRIDEGVATIVRAVADNGRVAVHCGGGLGRTGTLVACYLVHQGHPASDAIAQLRTLRPGSIETASQVRAVTAYEIRHGSGGAARSSYRP